MIDGPAVLTVFFVYLAGVVIPGPNFVAVVHKAVAATRSEALALVAGIVLVNLFWATCAIAGIGVVFAAFPWAALIVKVLGAAYLMWFGFRLLLKAGKSALAPWVRRPASSGVQECHLRLRQKLSQRHFGAKQNFIQRSEIGKTRHCVDFPTVLRLKLARLPSLVFD